jgi:phospholipid/cholesterol/gamma-HCH transport system substrate-binding protein
VKRLSGAVKVGILFMLLLAGSYGVWKTIGQSPSGEDGFGVWARFADASGLPEGSRIQIAGLPVGEISDLGIDGRYARVTMRIRGDVPLYDNAIAMKKSSSLLGDYFIELDPGTPESVDATGQRKTHRRLESGDQIIHVVEATSIDQVMRKVEQSMPRVDALLLSVRDLSEDVRALVNGPLASSFSRLDQLVQEEAATVASILERTDRTIARIEQIAGDIRGVTQTADDRVKSILDNFDKASAEARVFIETAQGEVEQTGSMLRAKLDQVDGILEPTASVARKIDDDKGTLGRLVNDPTIADNIEDITEDAKGFLGTIFGMQTYVGLRSEWSFAAADLRSYLTVELQTRPDKFYYIELSKSQRGDYPTVELVFDRETGNYRQDAVIADRARFTFQFAKRFDWLTVRYGLKESTGGVGVDAEWFDRNLKLSADVFDGNFDRFPRVKLAAAYRFFGYLYVLGGVDELLNEPKDLIIDPIGPNTSTGQAVPSQFSKLHLGRDYFLGASIRFNDLDLAALLTVGGAALSGALD